MLFLLKWKLNSTDPEKQIGAINELTVSPDPLATSLIAETLIQAIDRVKNRNSGSNKESAKKTDFGKFVIGMANVQRAAANALGEREDSLAVDALIRALKEGAEGYVKIAAAKALARIRDARAVGPLVTSLSQAGSLWTLKAAYANALSEIGDPTAVAALESSLKQAQEHWNDRRLQLAESDAPRNDISRQLCEQDFREVQAAISQITEALRKLGGKSTAHAQFTQ